MVKKALILIAGLALLLALAEAVLRIQGFRPKGSTSGNALQISPNHLFVFDSLLGMKMVPGRYELTQLGKRFVITIDSTGHRAKTVYASRQDTNQARIFFLGGVAVFGYGVNDTETCSAFAQALLPAYDVRNITMLNFGLAENYTQLTQLTDLKKNDLVIYVYRGEQDIRGPNMFLKQPDAFPDVETILPNYHYLIIDSNLVTHLQKFAYQHIPCSSFSALANNFEMRRNAAKNKNVTSHQTAQKALLAMDQFCKKKGCRFLLIYRKQDNFYKQTLKFCADNGIKAAPLFVEISPKLKNQEPLYFSQKRFAEQLVNYMLGESVVDTAAAPAM